jgi:hypothetical protein
MGAIKPTRQGAYLHGLMSCMCSLSRRERHDAVASEVGQRLITHTLSIHWKRCTGHGAASEGVYINRAQAPRLHGESPRHDSVSPPVPPLRPGMPRWPCMQVPLVQRIGTMIRKTFGNSKVSAPLHLPADPHAVTG